jgi:hypothetical protein
MVQNEPREFAFALHVTEQKPLAYSGVGYIILSVGIKQKSPFLN